MPRLTKQQKQALQGKPAPAPLSPQAIADRLFQLRWADRYGQGHFVHDRYDPHPVSFDADGTFFSAEPTGRQRLDHYGNDGDGWDSEGWEDDYARPLRKAVQAAADKEFGAGVFVVEIGEKGHVYFHLQKPVLP